MKKIESFFIVSFIMLFVLGCNKKWEDHNAIMDENVANNLFENINKNSNLSKFSEYLVKTGYDKVLAGSKAYTVWAPSNAALSTLDASIVADTAKLKLFVANHIANQTYLSAAAAQRIPLLNGKYSWAGNNKFDSANISTANIAAANGVYHVIDKFIPRYDNCWEWLRNSSTIASSMRSYLIAQDYLFFDPTIATQIGVNAQGDPVYDTASGQVKKNRFLEGVLDVSDEKSEYTMLVLTDASFNTEYNKLSPWFKTGTVDSTRNLTSAWLVKDLVFKGAYTAAQIPDTLLSLSGVKVPVQKSAIIASYKTSNGWVHVMSKVDFSLNNKFPSILIQGENPTSFVVDRPGNTQYRQRFNPLTNQNFSDILMQNYGYANYFIRYLVRNMPSMRYNAYWVAVNDVQTTPLWNQRLAIDSSTAATTNLPFVTVQFKNYAEVPLGQFTVTNYRNVNLFVMGPTTSSTSGGVNSIVLDYIRLEPAF